MNFSYSALWTVSRPAAARLEHLDLRVARR